MPQIKLLQKLKILTQIKNMAPNSISAQRVLPLFYHDNIDVCVGVLGALYRAGIRIVEFTNRGDKALANFSSMANFCKSSLPDMVLTIGTIKTLTDAKNFHTAGATTLISPIFNDSVADYANENGLLWIPGCMTPTEVFNAENAGCSLVKLFPGNVLQPQFVAAIRELFPTLQFMATGGVSANKENLQCWFNAGVTAVGIGSNLISKTTMDEKNFEKIEQDTLELLAMLRTIKK